MKNKILVPVDFSVNSKTGIKFAIQLALQTKNALIFYHTTRLLKPARWSEEKYQAYLNKELEAARSNLYKFVKKVSKKDELAKLKFECIVQQGADVQRSIIGYAAQIKADYICISTRGAGRFKKIIGTNASKILTQSPVPVFVIPGTYRRTPLTHILYSADFNDLKAELKQVRSVSRSLKAKVSVYHYDYLFDLPEIRKKLEKAARPFKGRDIKFNFRKANLDQPLARQLTNDVRKSKASLLVLFTNQQRGWFDKLFLPSKSAEVSFASKIPMLVFSKNVG